MESIYRRLSDSVSRLEEKLQVQSGALVKKIGVKKMGRRLFCEISPFCYNISLKKEICKRKVKDALSKEKFAEERSDKELDNIVKGHSSVMIRRLHGVDIRLQENKVTNIRLACGKINGIVVHPG